MSIGPRSVVHSLHCVGILWSTESSSTNTLTVFRRQVLHRSMTSHTSHIDTVEGNLCLVKQNEKRKKKWVQSSINRSTPPIDSLTGRRGSGSSCIMHLSTSQLSQTQINSHRSTCCFANIKWTPCLGGTAHKNQNSWYKRGADIFNSFIAVQLTIFHFSRPLIAM